MYYDPYDEEVQVKFHRTDPTGRIVPLETDDDEFTGSVVRTAVALVIGIILVLTAVGAYAETRLVVNAASYHYDREHAAVRGLREFNPGLGVQTLNGDDLRMAGLYRNSYGKPTGYALAGKMANEHIGLVAGAVFGYSAPVMPAIAMVVTLGPINVIFTPTASIGGKRIHGFAGLQYSWEI